MPVSTSQQAADPPRDVAVTTGRAPRRRPVFYPLRVAAVEPLTDDAVTITFDVPHELREDYEFAAGQHLTIRAEIGGEEMRRNYSICAPVGGPLRIAVRRLYEGGFSAYATSEVRPGDVLDVLTPTGRFTLRPDPDHARHVAAIAAGSGITPIMSILSTLLEHEPDSHATLLYGNRTSGSIMFLEELADLKDRYTDRLLLLNVLSRETQGAELLHGRIDAGKLSILLDTVVPFDAVDDWFLCGPYGLIEDARTLLLDSGTPQRHVHLELFHPEGEEPGAAPATGVAAEGGRSGGAAEADDASDVTVLLAGRSTALRVPRAGDSILDATLRQRREAPYACKGGVCGTCRAKLVSGEVHMDRNHALEDDETDAGFVLACQSHPVTDEVILDFDQ